MSAKKILIVQHMDWEGPGGHLLAALAGAGIDYEIAAAWHRPLHPLTLSPPSWFWVVLPMSMKSRTSPTSNP